MKLHRDEKPLIVVPIKQNFGFYKCTCGNILTSYQCQKQCERCKAELDWDNVMVEHGGELEDENQWI